MLAMELKQWRLLTQAPTHGLSCDPDFLTMGWPQGIKLPT